MVCVLVDVHVADLIIIKISFVHFADFPKAVKMRHGPTSWLLCDPRLPCPEPDPSPDPEPRPLVMRLVSWSGDRGREEEEARPERRLGRWPPGLPGPPGGGVEMPPLPLK